VRLYSSRPRLSRITSEDLPPEGGPSSKSSRLPTSEPAAAALNSRTSRSIVVVDAVELVLEKLTAPAAVAVVVPRAHHVPYILNWLERAMPRAPPENPSRSWKGCRHDDSHGRWRCQLFEDELYGIDDTIERWSTTSRPPPRAPSRQTAAFAARAPSGASPRLVILLKRGPGGIQPHRRRRALRHPRLPGARVAAAFSCRTRCARRSARRTASTSPASFARTA